MSALNYGSEKLMKAIYTLLGFRSIKERLTDAYVYNVIHVSEDNVPEESVPLLNEIKEELTKAGTVEATVNQMSDEAAAEWVRKIFSLFLDVENARE